MLPISDVKWEPLIPLIGRANRAIAGFDGILHSIPNPDVLLSPLTTQEAVLSSKIEGTQATLAEVFKFEAGEYPEQTERRQDIEEILNYRRALYEAEKELRMRPFNLNLLLDLHSMLLDGVRGQDRGRGRVRTMQNWIGSPGSSIEHAQFVPPDPSFVPQLLDNWEKYYHADRPDPLVQLAIVHAQFEIIHPFSDGNGRIGRILIPLFLFEKSILERPVFYLSTWIENHRNDYIDRLRNIGTSLDSWNQWIEFFLMGLEEQARRNSGRVKVISDLYHQSKSRILKLTRSQFAVPLLDQLFSKPVFQSSNLIFSPAKPSGPMIASLLKSLRDAGVLKILRKGSGRRPTIYAFTQLLTLLTLREDRIMSSI